MAVALEDTPVKYEDLAEIEREFDDVETEIIRQQVKLTQSLYERRHKLVSQIPNFWPLVLEQAPPDIDQYIQPSDSALLLSALKSLSVSHFEIEDEESSSGDPRSIAFTWEFADNDHFENRTLEKKFWYRRAKDGWTGLVSEPVKIQWKPGKDLTGGLLDLVYNTWTASQRSANGQESEKKRRDPSGDEMELLDRIEKTGIGGLSFFAWFGFIGRRVTADESAAAKAKELERRNLWKEGKTIEDDEGEDNDEEALSEELDASLEIFPDGDDLAVAFAEDLWPGALKLFTQAQEQDTLSDADFESDEEEILGQMEADSSDSDAGEEPPAKRVKS